ncbi:MAG: UDP-N-acetylmuramoyl-tripeptide--D-alanyl-D-alanine ligase [Clostridiales bacterium]|nr:UDP-N-acetylmuramoyl-tripeptide--D-alanyl-D-alanine ligase [Clostridiales bacterium]
MPVFLDHVFWHGITVLLAILFPLIYLPIRLKHDLHMLQQNYYRNERYLRWRREHRRQERNVIAWLPVVLIAAIFMWPAPYTSKWSIAQTVLCMLAMLTNMGLGNIEYQRSRRSAKKPLVMTARAKRLYIIALGLIISAILPIYLFIKEILSVTLSSPLFLLSLLLLLSFVALPLYSGYYLLFVNRLLQPLEQSIGRKYLQEGKQILASRPDLICVGITGSYGKTSCKMILDAMLSEKFITLATPGSVNMPLGVTRIIREQLKPIHEIFICEMGARQSGDIKELCDLVQPQMGILTAIGPQHLETFGSLQAVAETKYELIMSLPPQGTAVLNLDQELIAAREHQAPCAVIGYGLKQTSHYHAKDIRYDAQGLHFTLVTPAGERQPMRSLLLGRHNISNIVGAAAAAHTLGLPLPLAARAVSYLKPLPHRLQLIQGHNYIVIDDAFSSNPVGAASALEVLSQMSGGRKIMVTPGMVELGSEQYELNRAFAREAAKVCDYIILVGKKHSLPLQEGLKEAGYHDYAVAKDLDEARTLLTAQARSGDTVLFENDLPDTYNE